MHLSHYDFGGFRSWSSLHPGGCSLGVGRTSDDGCAFRKRVDNARRAALRVLPCEDGWRIKFMAAHVYLECHHSQARLALRVLLLWAINPLICSTWV